MAPYSTTAAPTTNDRPARARRDDSARRDDVPPLDASMWRAIQNVVRQHHPAMHRVWFDDMRAYQLTNGVIQVRVPNMAQLNYCQSHMQQPFTSAAQEVTGRLVAVSFHCENLPKGGVFTDGLKVLPLHPDLSFEHFVSGPCNRLAHAAAQAVADQPGAAYNPLFIHGPVGLGKTHLLQAIAQRLLEHRPSSRILYLSCDSFVNQFIEAVSHSNMANFRNMYRNVDVLVIDDIHFLAGRDQTQEEFFHTFNTLHQSGKQIVLSADCSPTEIPELEQRLVSRFGWGLVARIEKPCFDTRVAILKRKAQLRGLSIPDNVLTLIANRIDSNTRALEGAITTLHGTARAENRGIDFELAKRVLGEEPGKIAKRITVEQIVQLVTSYYNVKLSDLQSKRRNASIAFPRQVCMYLARKHTQYSLGDIGGYFGGRDHTTVLHGVRAVKDRMTVDHDIAGQLDQLERHLETVA